MRLKNGDPNYLRTLGMKRYEMTNHLGNVLVVVSDKKIITGSGPYNYDAEVITAQDYYAFGAPMYARSYQMSGIAGYRYAFNGMEKDNEIDDADGDDYTADYWEYDPRIGRRWNIDPVVLANQSVYATFDNNPVLNSDPNGAAAPPEPDHSYTDDPDAPKPQINDDYGNPKIPHGTSYIYDDGTSYERGKPTLTTSEKGKTFIKSWESYVGYVYDDGVKGHPLYTINAKGRPTVGYGHLLTPSETKEFLAGRGQYANGLKEPAALKLFLEDLKPDEKQANSMATWLTQNEYDAMVDFYFNTKAKSQISVIKAVNIHNIPAIKKAFMSVVHATITKHGVTVLVTMPGLVDRRSKELEMFINNRYINH